jgi:hypothetical protein
LRFGLALMTVTAALLVCVGPASAATVSSCSALQPTLNAAVSGDTVTLTVDCTGPFYLPTGQSINFEGLPAGSTLSGADSAVVLSGNNVGTTVLRNLIFRNGLGTNGAAVSITGTSTPTFENDQFYDNHASGNGGAIYVGSTATSGATTVSNSTLGASLHGNTAAKGAGAYVTGPQVVVTNSTFAYNTATDHGGGLYTIPGSNDALGGPGLVVTGSTFTQNRVTGTSAVDAPQGGGAYLDLAIVDARLSANTFSSNQLVPTATATFAAGAGLRISGSAPTQNLITSMDNVFTSNAVRYNANPNFSSNGGGAWIEKATFASTRDRFVGNSLAAHGATSGHSWGAGLGLEGCPGTAGPLATLTNDVVAGNIGGGEAAGGGIYVRCSGSYATLTLINSTVTANTVGSGTAGVAADSSEDLISRNSILNGNTGGPDLDLVGFPSADVTFSDLCDSGVPFGAAADHNICAPPQLVNADAGDVHETSSSPTIDKGSNAALPGGLMTDYENDPRIRDGDGDGTQTVDIGADESPTVTPPVPPSAESPPPSGGETTKPSGGETPAPATGAGPAAGPGSAAVLTFAVAKPRVGKGGAITLSIDVGGNGVLDVLATYPGAATAVLNKRAARLVYARVRRAVKAGRVIVTIKPKKSASKALARLKKVTVNLRIVYTPAGGAARTVNRKVVVNSKTRK